MPVRQQHDTSIFIVNSVFILKNYLWLTSLTIMNVLFFIQGRHFLRRLNKCTTNCYFCLFIIINVFMVNYPAFKFKINMVWFCTKRLTAIGSPRDSHFRLWTQYRMSQDTDSGMHLCISQITDMKLPPFKTDNILIPSWVILRE